jgi:hypothetical protein
MNNTAEMPKPSEQNITPAPSTESSSAPSGKPKKRAKSTIASSKRKLEAAIEAAEDHLKEIKDWIALHNRSGEQPGKTPQALSSQMQSKLEKVSIAHDDLSKAQTKAASTTVASVISAIGPNLDLQSIDEMLKAGKEPHEIVEHLSNLLHEAVNG